MSDDFTYTDGNADVTTYRRYFDARPGAVDKDFAGYMAQRFLASRYPTSASRMPPVIAALTSSERYGLGHAVRPPHDGGPFMHAPPDPLDMFRSATDPPDVE